MSDANPPPDPTKKFSPEAEASARIETLQAAITALEKDLRTAQGKVTNRDPQAAARLKKENEALVLRTTVLEKALFALVADSVKPRKAEDETLQYEVLRQAAVDYCKKTNLDPELWKSIVS